MYYTVQPNKTFKVYFFQVTMYLKLIWRLETEQRYSWNEMNKQFGLNVQTVCALNDNETSYRRLEQ